MGAVVHRYWRGEERDDAAWTAAAIASTCRSIPHDWTDEELSLLVEPAVLADPDPRHVANVVRYTLMLEFGGLWLDHDMVPLADLTMSARPWTASLGRRTREACAMWFPEPGHPMMAAALARALASAPTLPSPARSGAGILTAVGDHDDVAYNEAVLPIDRAGTRRGTHTPTAVHLWSTSVQNGARDARRR